MDNKNWFVLGSKVTEALPINASLLRPSGKDFAEAARKLNISSVDSRIAHGVFHFDEIPSKIAPIPHKVKTEKTLCLIG